MQRKILNEKHDISDRWACRWTSCTCEWLFWTYMKVVKPAAQSRATFSLWSWIFFSVFTSTAFISAPLLPLVVLNVSAFSQLPCWCNQRCKSSNRAHSTNQRVTLSDTVRLWTPSYISQLDALPFPEEVFASSVHSLWQRANESILHLPAGLEDEW